MLLFPTISSDRGPCLENSGVDFVAQVRDFWGQIGGEPGKQIFYAADEFIKFLGPGHRCHYALGQRELQPANSAKRRKSRPIAPVNGSRGRPLT